MKIALTTRLAAVVVALAATSALAETDGSIGGGNSGDENHYILECGGVCQGYLAGGAITPSFTGAWFDPAQSGHGLFIEILPDNKIQAAWFTFNPAGTEQAWFVGVGTYAGNTATISAMTQPTGGRWIPNFDPRQVMNNSWGSLTLTFVDADHGRVDFSSVLGYGSGSMDLTRLTQPVGSGAATSASAKLPQWITINNLTASRYGHTATLLDNGSVLIVGGTCDEDFNPAEVYNSAAGRWTAISDPGISCIGRTATVLPGGQVLIVGGALDWMHSAVLFDPRNNEFRFTGNPTSPLDRVDHTATLLKTGKVLIAGGSSSGSTYLLYRSAALYDPVAGAWSNASDLPAERTLHQATLLQDGRVLVTGGSDISHFALARVEIYDAVAGTWSIAAPLNVARREHTATLLSDGRVLVVGGSDVTELFDPATGQWSITGSLAAVRKDHTATLLSDGRVLIAGGTAPGSGLPLDSAELYDTVTGAWSGTATLNVPRAYHTATLMRDGNVLVASGNTAEVYGVEFPPGTIARSFTGSWYNPAQSGHGVLVEVLPGNQFLAAWFTFNPAGTSQSWFIGVGSYIGNTASITSVYQPTGGRWIPRFDPSRVVNKPWGTLTFTFTDCNNGRVDFSSTNGYGSGSMILTRLTQPIGFTCPGAPKVEESS